MNFVSAFMAVFSVLGAADLIFGGRLGLGKEFEKGFMLLGRMALSMIGMIVIAPVIGTAIQPALDALHRLLRLEPSVIPAMLLANDMGGAPLATTVAGNDSLGLFNALVVSSMMGCTISFTIPFALDVTEKRQHKGVLAGLLCGIVTIPLGCFVSGLMLGLPLPELLGNLLPLLVFSCIVACGIFLAPGVCVRVFSIFGRIIKILIIIGLVLGILRFLLGIELVKGLETLENGTLICMNAAAVMSGAFPFMLLLSKLLTRPLRRLGERLNINQESAFGLVSTLATTMTTFSAMKEMDDRGVLLNAAFAVSAGFTFAGHLAFTLAYNADYVAPVITGKLVAGFTALLLAVLLQRRLLARV